MLLQSSQLRRPGATLVKVLILLPVIIGIAALSLDGGRLHDERRHAQATADAAALAAAADLYTNVVVNKGKDPAGTARAAAVQVAAANGYPASAVTVTIPPATGAFAGQSGYAEVSISSKVDASFGKALTTSEMSVGARSVARGEPLKFGIVTLNPSLAGSFTNNAPVFALVNKPLVVNSAHAQALKSSSLVWLSLSRVDVTGGVDNASLLTLNMPIRTGVRPTGDPLESLPLPDSTGAPVRSITPLTINSLVSTLQPGVYKGGIRITGLSTVVMSAGVYIMEGGGFQVDGLATVTGLGTVVYNTTSSTYASGPISVTGLGKVVMTAPVTGTYTGFNFLQHRGLTQPISITGLGLTTITGAVYAKAAHVDLGGSLAVGLDIRGGAFVVDTLTVGGVAGVTVDLRDNAPKVPDIRLVE